MSDLPSHIKSSMLYREFQAEREKILEHKWELSEKAGYDVGFEYALTDWIVKHRSNWRKEWMREHERDYASARDLSSKVKPNP